MPRALTEQEKEEQRQRLLEKGKSAVMSYGLRKVSVDDIAKVSGLAKGTFYQHYESKEHYLCVLIEKLHGDAFLQAERLISDGVLGKGDLKENMRGFLQKLLYWPEMVFFIRNESDINVLYKNVPSLEFKSFKQREVNLFERILSLLGIDVKKVKPGVVHNFVHLLFLIKSSEYMAEEDLQETVDLIMDSLISYAFGGVL